MSWYHFVYYYFLNFNYHANCRRWNGIPGHSCTSQMVKCCNQNVIKYIFGIFFLHGVAVNKRIVTIFSLELTKHLVWQEKISSIKLRIILTENYPNQMSIDKHVYAYHITCVACDFFISKWYFKRLNHLNNLRMNIIWN